MKKNSQFKKPRSKSKNRKLFPYSKSTRNISKSPLKNANLLLEKKVIKILK